MFRMMKVLRRQAKQTAIEAGLRKHAEVTGRIAVVRTPEELEAERKRAEEAAIRAREFKFNNGPSRIVADDYGLGGGQPDFMDFEQYGNGYDDMAMDVDVDGDGRGAGDDSSDDSE